MKQLIFFCSLMLSLAVQAQTVTLKPGTVAPDFNLKNITGESVTFSTFSNVKGYILVFTCNTCPVAQAYEQRIIELNAKFAALGYPVIAINTNDPQVSPGDSFEAMGERYKTKKYGFPYLFDDGQKMTTDYGARNTPTIFLVKHSKNGNIIAYTGAIDNDPEEDKSERINYVQLAISALEQGKDPVIASTKAIGCSVRRKKSN